MADAPTLTTGWTEPQSITDAQKTGERFLVWHAREYQRGWHVAKWDNYVERWLRGGGEEHYLKTKSVTHFLPLPPDVEAVEAECADAE